jgi:hypothetical protein
MSIVPSELSVVVPVGEMARIEKEAEIPLEFLYADAARSRISAAFCDRAENVDRSNDIIICIAFIFVFLNVYNKLFIEGFISDSLICVPD